MKNQSSLEVSDYSSYPLNITGYVMKVYEDDENYLFDIMPIGGYGELPKCYLFCDRKPKVDDIVAVTFFNNRTQPGIIGVMQQPEKLKEDQDYVTEHPSGTKQTIRANGDVLIEDKHGNKFEMTAEGVKINDHYIMTEDWVDWFNAAISALGMGNLGAPVPVNPTHLPTFVKNYLLKDKYKTDRLTVPGV